MASIMIRDKMGRLSDGIQAITPAQARVAQKHHIPTFRGVLYEKDEFGNLMFVNSNTVVLGGSINALEKLCGTMATYRPQSLTMQYKEKLSFPSSIGVNYNAQWENDHEDDSIIALFGVGTGGCGMDISQVYKPDFKQRTLNTIKDGGADAYGNWLPFRVSQTESLDTPGVLPGEDNKSERAKYHFRMKLSGESTDYYGWFLKNFEGVDFGSDFTKGYNTGCKITTLWKNAPDLSKDGTEIKSDDDLTTGPEGVGIESFAEFTLRIGPDDVRAFFVDTGSAETPRFNTLGLFTGVPAKLDDAGEYVEYYNVRLFSVVNFENVAKRLRNDAVYVYRVYSAL